MLTNFGCSSSETRLAFLVFSLGGLLVLGSELGVGEAAWMNLACSFVASEFGCTLLGCALFAVLGKGTV
jgi:hypothetical protein